MDLDPRGGAKGPSLLRESSPRLTREHPCRPAARTKKARAHAQAQRSAGGLSATLLIHLQERKIFQLRTTYVHSLLASKVTVRELIQQDVWHFSFEIEKVSTRASSALRASGDTSGILGAVSGFPVKTTCGQSAMSYGRSDEQHAPISSWGNFCTSPTGIGISQRCRSRFNLLLLEDLVVIRRNWLFASIGCFIRV